MAGDVPTDVLETIREEQGGFWWAAQYQGDPQPVSGNLFRREFFRTFTTIDDGYQLGSKPIPVDACTRFAIADTALSERATADYTVVAMFATTPERDLILLERWRSRYSGPDQVKLIQHVYEEVEALIAVGAVADGLHHASAILDGAPASNEARAALAAAVARVEDAAGSPNSQAADVAALIGYLRAAVASSEEIDGQVVVDMAQRLGDSLTDPPPADPAGPSADPANPPADPADPPIDPGSPADAAGPPTNPGSPGSDRQLPDQSRKEK